MYIYIYIYIYIAVRLERCRFAGSDALLVKKGNGWVTGWLGGKGLALLDNNIQGEGKRFQG